MNCKQAQILIISLNGSSKEKKQQLENHLAHCPDCKKFKIQYDILRKQIEQEKFPTPPAKLQQRTKSLCHEKLLDLNSADFIASEKTAPPIPLLARIILTLLIVLISSWGVPVFKNYFEKNILTGETIYLFILLGQNILALLCAPILLKFAKLKRQILISA